jgi:hypothetical protein
VTNLPLIYILGIPWLLFLVCRWHDCVIEVGLVRLRKVCSSDNFSHIEGSKIPVLRKSVAPRTDDLLTPTSSRCNTNAPSRLYGRSVPYVEAKHHCSTFLARDSHLGYIMRLAHYLHNKAQSALTPGNLECCLRQRNVLPLLVRIVEFANVMTI